MEYMSYGHSDPSFMTIDYHEECEILTVYNKMTIFPADAHKRGSIDLNFNDHLVFISFGAGDLPDTYYVFPRRGYTSDKYKALVNENESAVFTICPMLLS